MINRYILFKRNTVNQTTVGSVSLKSNRCILYKVTVCSYGKQGLETYFKTTDIRHLKLRRDEVCMVLEANYCFTKWLI